MYRHFYMLTKQNLSSPFNLSLTVVKLQKKSNNCGVIKQYYQVKPQTTIPLIKKLKVLNITP